MLLLVLYLVFALVEVLFFRIWLSVVLRLDFVIFLLLRVNHALLILCIKLAYHYAAVDV